VAALLLSLPLAAQDPAPKAPKKETKVTKTRDYAHTLAVLKTTQGDVTLRFFYDKAPTHVKNFIDLSAKGFYDGTAFHRVIPEFMIQGGDPLGRGTGGPGFRFEDEFTSGRKFDRPGMLAMANSGPGTNGSQFFITVVATPWLNNRHTIFGEVISGQDVIDRIANIVPKDSGDRPKTEIKLKKLKISDKP
jgi:peptidyl-prolyl cis-trans isomerase A (cyclophilin A)